MIRKKILKNIEDSYVTEEELLEKLDITHEKLKDHILNLKDVGYDILYDLDKGYKLKDVPDILDAYEVARGLKTEMMGNSIHFYDTLESTNDTAKKFVEDGAKEGSVIIAGSQTAGRTRKYDDWVSPEGGIYMTLILRPKVALQEASKLTIVTGVAIAKTLHDKFGINAGIKWPNDILIGDKKISGILTEAVTNYETNELEAVLVGIGIDANIKEEDIPDDLKEVATTIKKEIDKRINRADILRTFLGVFEELYKEFNKGNFKYIIAEWRILSSTTGNRVKVYKNGKVTYGDAVGITNKGLLIVEDDDGKLIKISSGVVEII